MNHFFPSPGFQNLILLFLQHCDPSPLPHSLISHVLPPISSWCFPELHGLSQGDLSHLYNFRDSHIWPGVIEILSIFRVNALVKGSLPLLY